MEVEGLLNEAQARVRICLSFGHSGAGGGGRDSSASGFREKVHQVLLNLLRMRPMRWEDVESGHRPCFMKTACLKCVDWSWI